MKEHGEAAHATTASAGERPGSIQARVGIRRSDGASEADGARFIDYWANAILADLTAYWNDARQGRLKETVPALARAAHRWFADAWRSAGRTSARAGARHQIDEFRLLLFSQPKQQGEVLAEIDVLSGQFRIYRS